MIENTALILQTPYDVLLQMANRARSLCLEQNMPQAELARRVGVAVGTVKRFEKTGEFVEATTSSDDPSYFLLFWSVVTILQHFLFCKRQGIQECLHRRFLISILPAVRT